MYNREAQREAVSHPITQHMYKGTLKRHTQSHNVTPVRTIPNYMKPILIISCDPLSHHMTQYMAPIPII